MNSGIYKIINKITGHYYVGKSKDIKKRFNDHKYYLNRNKHKNYHLQNAWNKYGADAFDFVVVEYLEPNEVLLTEAEQKYLDKFVEDRKNGVDDCYNMAETSEGGFISEEANRKKSVSLKGEKHPLYGKAVSQERREKQSRSMMGKMNGEKNPMYGKPVSEETRKKQSQARKGKYVGNKHGRWKNVDDNVKNEIVQHSKISYSSAIKFAKLHNLGYRVVDRILKEAKQAANNGAGTVNPLAP